MINDSLNKTTLLEYVIGARTNRRRGLFGVHGLIEEVRYFELDTGSCANLERISCTHVRRERAENDRRLPSKKRGGH